MPNRRGGAMPNRGSGCAAVLAAVCFAAAIGAGIVGIILAAR